MNIYKARKLKDFIKEWKILHQISLTKERNYFDYGWDKILTVRELICREIEYYTDIQIDIQFYFDGKFSSLGVVLAPKELQWLIKAIKSPLKEKQQSLIYKNSKKFFRIKPSDNEAIALEKGYEYNGNSIVLQKHEYSKLIENYESSIEDIIDEAYVIHNAKAEHFFRKYPEMYFGKK
jgi:hypothetical protein